MDNNKIKSRDWFNRIKYRNRVYPSLTTLLDADMEPFDVNLQKRRNITQCLNKIANNTKARERDFKVAPLCDITPLNLGDIQKSCRDCPSTVMSRFLEKNILRKINARGLETEHPALLKSIINEAKEEFLKVTHESGVEMKLKSVGKKFTIRPFKNLGRTENYEMFLRRRRDLEKNFILHHRLIRRILQECVANLPCELFDLTKSLGMQQLDIKEFESHLQTLANDATQYLQEFYRKVVMLVNNEEGNTQVNYLSACTGLLSVHISKSVAQTLLHVAHFTSLKDHLPYLRIHVSFKDRLIIHPTADLISDIYEKFLKKIVNDAEQFYVLEKYKLEGYDTKRIHLCLTDDCFKSIITEITSNLCDKFQPILTHIEELDNDFNHIYGDLESGAVLSSDLLFDSAREKILQLKFYLSKLAFIPDKVYFTIGELFLSECRETIKQNLLSVVFKIFNNLSAQHEWENTDICEAFDIIKVRATQIPITTEEVIEVGKYMTWVKDEFLEQLKNRVAESLEFLCKLILLGTLDNDHLAVNARAIKWLDDIELILEENNATYEQLKFEAEEKLQRVIEDITVYIKDIYPLLEILDTMDDIKSVRNYLNRTTLHLVKKKEIENQINWINQEEVSLSFPKSSYPEFEELKNYVYPFHHLLKLCLDVQRYLSVWLDGQFDLINHDRTQCIVENFYKELTSTQKTYRSKLRQAQDENLPLRFKGTVDDPDMLNWPAPLKLCSKAINLIEDFKPCLTVIKIMCNEALMRRHWIEMSKVATFDITPNCGTTLRKIMQIDLASNMDQYQLISVAATNEKKLLENLKEMHREWIDVNFKTGEKAEGKIIVELEEIETVADDHIIKVIQMLTSIFVKPYQDEVKSFHHQLLKIKETVKETREMQCEWYRLLPLFPSDEIAEQMHVQSELFQGITETYKYYLDIIIAQPNVWQTVIGTEILRELKICNHKIQSIKKGVDDYLEGIRQHFPRFYFLSGNEMLRALFMNKKIDNSIKKLFPSITKLQFNTNLDVVGLYSQTDMTELKQIIPTKCSAKKWFKELDDSIQLTMRSLIEDSLQDYFKTGPVKLWIDKWSTQISTVVLQIDFSASVHRAIETRELKFFIKSLNTNTNNLIKLSKSGVTQRVSLKTLNIIITSLNHENIVSKGIQSVDDFHWRAQLLFYMDKSVCRVQNLDTILCYGNEYLGDISSIVITPQTEKYYRILMTTYANNLHGSCYGQSGSGKTEIVQSLATSLGVYCLTYASAHLDLTVIRNLLKGVSCCGSWLIFEEFDRVKTDISTVIAQEIWNIRNLLDPVEDLRSNSSLKHHFICFNYSNRGHSITKDLRVFLRPVSMVQPHFQLIAEVYLIALGFSNAKSLSHQIQTIQQVSEDVLGHSITLKTIKKSILLKNVQAEHKDDEEVFICKTLYKTIRPTLSIKSLQQFETILECVFPLLNLEQIKEMKTCHENIVTVCRELQLEPTTEFLSKISDMVNLLKSKTGLVIVGKAFSGKTTLIRAVSKVLQSKVHQEFIYVETMSFAEQFGSLNKSDLWCDGVITRCLRQSNTEEYTWIILDGLIHPSSIDMLNSLLGASSNLCLPSGELLHLEEKTNVIFEMDNLNSASPNLVAHCGLIYVESETIQWEWLLNSRMDGNNFYWSKGHQESVLNLFRWLIPPCLDFIKRSFQLCRLNKMSLIKTVINLFEIIAADAFGNNSTGKKEEDAKHAPAWIQASIIQAFILGLGSMLDLDGILKFDEFFKHLWKGNTPMSEIEKLEVSVPIEGLIYDHFYIYKMKGTWKLWSDVLKHEKIDKSCYLTDFLIPTVETMKYSWLLNMHINHNYPVLLIGPRCSGKTILFNDLVFNKVNKDKYEPSIINFSPMITVREIQKAILSKMFKARSGNYGPSLDKTTLLFIDDFNLPLTSNLEIIRQVLDRKIMFDLNTTMPFKINNFNLICAMSTFEGNILHVPLRLLRHFDVFYTNKLLNDSMVRIYTSILTAKWKADGFPTDIASTANQIVTATINVYENLIEYLKPSLQSNLYYFSLRNISKVIQICTMVKRETWDSNKKIFVKLWTHEMFREFGDRISKDKEWFSNTTKKNIEEIFGEDLGQLFEQCEPSELVFGTYVDKSGFFDEVTNLSKLHEIARLCLSEYNKVNENKIDLLLFNYTLEHLTRVCRVLSTKCTNLLQLGPCGSGRSTITKLASIIVNQEFYSLDITYDYNEECWRNHVKGALLEAGSYGRPCIFYIREEAITLEGIILEDLYYLIKTGEIPNLLTLEERKETLDIVRESIKSEDMNFDLSSQSIFYCHQKRCRENLHIILSFNLNSSKFRKYLQKYSLLRDYCEIDNFENWPQDALRCIAKAYLAPLELPEGEHIETAFSNCHESVRSCTNKAYITNGSYLEFVGIYLDLMTSKKSSIINKKHKYFAALEKLSFAEFQISEMQKSLADYQPQLQAMTLNAVEMAQQIEKETIEVEIASDLVKRDEITANEQAAAAQILKLDCEADLAQAIPILEDAISALNTLKPTDITLVKSMKNPPDAIKLVMAAVCVIKDIKPDRIPDPSTGRKIIEYWGPSKRILGDMNFLQALKDFDKDNIKPEVMVKIRKDYLPHKDFKPHVVAKASSAAEGLCKWIIAMDMYDKVAKEVAPKKEKLEKAEQEYATTVSILNEKKEQVAKIEQKLADLNALLSEAKRKQQQLQKKVDACKIKLKRAQKLIGNLGSEKIRWTNAVSTLELQYETLAFDVLLASAIIAYLGQFSKDERLTIYTAIEESVATPKVTIIKLFEDDVNYHIWNICGLPQDEFFLQNGLIVTYSKRWSLLIDPQAQGANWIKEIEKYNSIVTTKITCRNHVNIIANCVEFGRPLLLEYNCENIIPYLWDLISKAPHTQGGTKFLNIGGLITPYNDNFILYMRTCSKYPQYAPEVFDKVNVIQFTITSEALENSLLTCLVEMEKPALKKMKSIFNSERESNKNTLRDIEEKILITLAESTIDILEDDKVLQMLQDSKNLSRQIEMKQDNLLETEKLIEHQRFIYKPVARHAAILCMCVLNLSKINHMYHFSFDFFLYFYRECILNAPRHRQISSRKESLIDTITFELYKQISSSILNRHRLLFAFLLAVNISLEKGAVTSEEVSFFKEKIKNVEDPGDKPEWLSAEAWHRIIILECVILDLRKLFLRDVANYKEIYESEFPEKATTILFNSSFQRLLLVRIIRPDRLFYAVEKYVETELGEKFTTPHITNINESFLKSYILSPLIFILDPTSNPLTSLINFARKKHFHNKLQIVSLVNGEEHKFHDLINNARKHGLWVCLQNCHQLDWLCYVELILEQIDYGNTNEDFRLLCTTLPTDNFPVSLLEKGVKIVTENAKDLRDNLLNLYRSELLGHTECPGKQEAFNRLLFGLAYFHCIVQGRSDFGQYGWNSLYDFAEEDFYFSVRQLQLYVSTSSIEFRNLQYLIGDCIYGGHIINGSDYKVISTILNHYVNEQLSINPSLIFKQTLPKKTDTLDYIKFIQELPRRQTAENVGLHNNYEIVKGLEYSTSRIMAYIYETPVSEINEESEIEIVNELYNNLPKQFTSDEIELITDSTIFPSIIKFELHCYEILLEVIFNDLERLRQVFDGVINISDELDLVYSSIKRKEVPTSWASKFNNKVTNLSHLLVALPKNLDFLKSFHYDNQIYLTSFYRPKAFLTALKLCYSQKRSVPFHKLNLGFSLSESESRILINGLFLIGGRWNEMTGCLDELLPKIIHNPLHITSLSFLLNNPADDKFYRCPLYKSLGNETPVEQSILIKTKKPQEHWIKRGVALYCEIAN